MAGGPDGWIRLEPGQAILVDLNNPEPGGDELIERMRKIRGTILSSALWVELNLEQAVSTYICGLEESKIKTFFSNEIFRKMNFERKITLAIKMAKDAEFNCDIAEKQQHLSKFRDTRNMMAHEPCWLEPVTEGQNKLFIGCNLWISKNDNLFPLNDHQEAIWMAELFSAVSAATELNRLARGEPLQPPFPSGTAVIVSTGLV